jgi:2',3'-cyclic-nucleotide 2'-phosphodiesterase (5'-nucleotidase family)
MQQRRNKIAQMTRFATVTIGLLLTFACDPTQKISQSGDNGAIDLIFLHMNDVYEISPLSDGTGGLARVATIRQELLRENPNTFTIMAGDFISPSVIGTLRHEGKRIRGKQMIESLNAVGVNWAVFGNHEFDYDDYADLQARLDESNFTWLGANVRYKNGDALPMPFFKNRPEGKVNCPDELVVPVKDADGTTINLGVLGVLLDSGRKPYVTYTDWMETAKQSRERLRPQTDLCVGITHLNIADDLKLAEVINDIPLYMGGHDHDNMRHPVKRSVVCKADANARTVYIHRVHYNKRTGKSTVKSELRQVTASIPDHSATAAVVAKWEDIKTKALSTSGFNANAVVTTLSAPLDCREGLIRHSQAPVGAMIIQGMLRAAKNQPDCAFFNSGSIRVDDVLKGQLLEIDLVRMLPFGGGLSEVRMTGALLQKTLDAGRNNKGSGGYLQLGKITNAADGSWIVNGQPLDTTKFYWVILPDFLLTGSERNMDFLKVELDPVTGKTNNADIPSILRPDPSAKNDVRTDIRLAVIRSLR